MFFIQSLTRLAGKRFYRRKIGHFVVQLVNVHSESLINLFYRLYIFFNCQNFKACFINIWLILDCKRPEILLCVVPSICFVCVQQIELGYCEIVLWNLVIYMVIADWFLMPKHIEHAVSREVHCRSAIIIYYYKYLRK